jgi:hypothetical protein
MCTYRDARVTEMPIATEKLPLPHRDVRKKSYHAVAAMNF